uniref:Annexin n=1 Tax=Schistosoma mansoni TaxID=6183 RepID=A0A5K4FB80_SCHMA
MENIKPNNLKLLIEDLLTDISILFAEELYKAISTSNIQITTSLLIDFWGDEFDQVKNVYKLYSNESIWKSIEERFGKPTEDFLQCVVETRKVKIKQETNEDTFGKPIVNMSEVNKTFHYLLKQKNSTNITEQQLSNLLCKLNPFQLEALDMMYQQDLKRTFFEVIKRRSSGQMHDLLLSLYTYSVNKPMYFATLFHDVLHKELISVLTAQRLLIFRSEVDLQLVCDIYEALYGTYLSDDVKQKYFGKQDNALTNLLKSEETTVVY